MSFFRSTRPVVTPPAPPPTCSSPSAPPPPAVTPAVESKPARSSRLGRRIVFLEPEAAVQAQWAARLKWPERSWEVVFAANAAEALQRCEAARCDALVALPQLRDRSGPELLNEVGRRYPHTARLLRCTPEARRDLKGFEGWPPQCVAAEPSPTDFEAAVELALQLNEWLSDPCLASLLPKLQKLPPVPTIYSQVATELASPRGSIDFVSKLIAKDPALTARILQLVNSPTFALNRQITEAVEAVMFLGGERTKSILLVASISLHFDSTRCPGFSQDRLWHHAVGVGSFARAVTLRETGDLKLGDQAFTAGLLHDIGKLLLASNLPETYAHAIGVAESQQLSMHVAEQLSFGASHAEVGACLLGTWGLPLSIVRAIAWHHRPGAAPERAFSLLTAVHAANVLEHERKKLPVSGVCEGFDIDYLQRLDLATVRNRWREMCGIDTKPEDEAQDVSAPLQVAIAS